MSIFYRETGAYPHVPMEHPELDISIPDVTFGPPDTRPLPDEDSLGYTRRPRDGNNTEPMAESKAMSKLIYKMIKSWNEDSLIFLSGIIKDMIKGKIKPPNRRLGVKNSSGSRESRSSDEVIPEQPRLSQFIFDDDLRSEPSAGLKEPDEINFDPLLNQPLSHTSITIAP